MISVASTKSLPSTKIIPQSLRRRVFLLALPAVGEQLLNTTVGLVDVYLVGHISGESAAYLGYGSAAALTGVGLANQITWLITMLFAAVAVGSTALIARAVGAKDDELANLALRQSLLVGGAMGLLGMLLSLLLAAPAMALLGAPAEAAPIGTDFLQLVALTFLPAALLFVGTAALRGAGDTRTPLLVMLGVNAINVLVSWLLINGQFGLPILGANGAAWGAALARGLGGVAVLVVLLRGRGLLRLTWNLQPHWQTVRRIVAVGAPSGAEQLVFQGALLLFVRLITGLGTAAYAAHNITITIESVSFLPGMGFAVAATTLVGQNLGARKPDDATRGAHEAALQGGAFMSLLGLVMIVFPVPLLALFSNDPSVVAAGIWPLRLAGLAQPALALSFIYSGALRGAGDTRWPLYTKIISTWGLRLPLALLLVPLAGLGLGGIWLAMVSDFFMQGLLAFWRFRRGAWKSIRV